MIDLTVVIGFISVVYAVLLEWTPKLADAFEELKPHVKRITVILGLIAIVVVVGIVGSQLSTQGLDATEALKAFLLALGANQGAHRLVKRSQPSS